MFDSIYNMDIEEVVRPEDARMYLRCLSEGASFRAGPLPLLILRVSLHALVLPMPEPCFERFWFNGLGWHEGVRFGSSATGRAFFAFGLLDSDEEPLVYVNTLVGDDGMEAVIDLLETLGLDDSDVVDADPSVRLDALPKWDLWRLDDNGNETMMETFRSRAKAVAAQEQYEARGHKQTYWVRQRRDP